MYININDIKNKTMEKLVKSTEVTLLNYNHGKVNKREASLAYKLHSSL